MKQEAIDAAMNDPHFLPAHMLAARTSAQLESHLQEDVRRFESVGREIRDVKDTMTRGFDKMDEKHDALSKDVSDLAKKLTYLLGGIITVIELVKAGIELVPKLLHGG